MATPEGRGRFSTIEWERSHATSASDTTPHHPVLSCPDAAARPVPRRGPAPPYLHRENSHASPARAGEHHTVRRRVARGRTVSPTEEGVARIWAESVGSAPAGVDTDFFDAGGSSLALVQFLAGVHDAYGVELPLDRLFTEGFTVAGAAAAVENLLLAGVDPAELDALTAELDGMSDEEIRTLLAEGS